MSRSQSTLTRPQFEILAAHLNANGRAKLDSQRSRSMFRCGVHLARFPKLNLFDNDVWRQGRRVNESSFSANKPIREAVIFDLRRNRESSLPFTKLKTTQKKSATAEIPAATSALCRTSRKSMKSIGGTPFSVSLQDTLTRRGALPLYCGSDRLTHDYR